MIQRPLCNAETSSSYFPNTLNTSQRRFSPQISCKISHYCRSPGNMQLFETLLHRIAFHVRYIFPCKYVLGQSKCYDGQNLSKDDLNERSDSFQSAYSGNFHWLGKMVQAFLSCVTTGNVKVQWNVCHALSNLFSNKTLKLQDMDWAPSVFSILLLLLRDSSNFKIRIQAAAALAVPESINVQQLLNRVTKLLSLPI
ncbi:unnamed protein product [Fraxinus pennsylvanica]|uniref:Uncharacterized protein n=1 Tax=Fraxinus pennsylvanica TaxID=56036 RepID=A0AAD2AE76_9LAMI|nr:unnamed protein product [Fraxinus pennsylvanica]